MSPRKQLTMARAAAICAVLGFVIALPLYFARPNDAPVTALRQASAEAAGAREVRAATSRAIASAKANAGAIEREADGALSRAAAARARARVVSADDVLVSATPHDTSAAIRVPEPVVTRLRLDSSAVAALGTLVRWKNTVIVAQDGRITADSVALVATSNAFDALQRVKEPRCGRRCGIVIGVGSMLLAAVAIDQVRRTFR
jgi:hypothetical protein